MKLVKKMGISLLGIVLGFCSCIDDTYDLTNKEIITDAAFENNKLSLPIGDLKPIMLESLIQAEENAAIKTIDGVYCMGMDGALEPMEYEIGSFRLKVEPSYSTKGLNFSKLYPGILMMEGTSENEILLSEVDIDAPMVVDEVVPEEVKRIESVGFAKEVPITIAISLEGLEALDAQMHIDLSFEVPTFLDWYCVEEGAVREGDRLLVAAEMNPYQDKHMQVQLMCRGLHFDSDEFEETQGILPKIDENGTNRLEYATAIHIHGDVFIDDIEWHDHILGEEVRLGVAVEAGEIEVHDFHGIYSQELAEHTERLELNLDEEFGILNKGDNVVALSDPRVTVELENMVAIPLSIDIKLMPIDEQGEYLSTIEIKNIEINAAQYDMDDGKLESRMTHLLFSSRPVDKQGYVNVVVEDLPNLLREQPDAVEIVMTPRIETDETHHLVLAEPLGLRGGYELMVPLMFDELHICYNDTVADVETVLGESLEMFEEFALKTKMKVRNTTPLGLVVSLQALDSYGVRIDDVEIEPVKLKAGNGGEFASAEVQEVELILNGQPEALCRLDKLAIAIEATAKEKVALETNQGLMISELVLELSGDILMDMEE